MIVSRPRPAPRTMTMRFRARTTRLPHDHRACRGVGSRSWGEQRGRRTKAMRSGREPRAGPLWRRGSDADPIPRSSFSSLRAPTPAFARSSHDDPAVRPMIVRRPVVSSIDPMIRSERTEPGGWSRPDQVVDATGSTAWNRAGPIGRIDPNGSHEIVRGLPIKPARSTRSDRGSRPSSRPWEERLLRREVAPRPDHDVNTPMRNIL